MFLERALLRAAKLAFASERERGKDGEKRSGEERALGLLVEAGLAFARGARREPAKNLGREQGARPVERIAGSPASAAEQQVQRLDAVPSLFHQAPGKHLRGAMVDALIKGIAVGVQPDAFRSAEEYRPRACSTDLARFSRFF